MMVKPLVKTRKLFAQVSMYCEMRGNLVLYCCNSYGTDCEIWIAQPLLPPDVTQVWFESAEK